MLASTTFVLIGLFAIWAQIPLRASTKPIDTRPPHVAAQHGQPSPESIVQIGTGFVLEPHPAKIELTTGNLRIECFPILEFDRVSPDCFWSILARTKKEHRIPRKQSRGANANTIQYSDGSVLELPAYANDGWQRLIAFTPIRQDTYSHLNTYCRFEISGHERLSLSFSPCPDAEIDVLPADYPTGRRFCIVEARSGEKGPFRPLATGELARGEALSIVVRDMGQPVATIRLEDWSAQVSTQLSPTAGWMLPVNAIEFQRLDDSVNSPAAIWITLAATSVGRGWETVGHRTGIYRNEVAFKIGAPGDTAAR